MTVPVHGEPPTAVGLRVDVSLDNGRASASPSGRARVTEADLMRTIGRPLRIVTCACDGEIAATDGDWDDVVEAIRTHNRSERHAAWRRWRES